MFNIIWLGQWHTLNMCIMALIHKYVTLSCCTLDNWMNCNIVLIYQVTIWICTYNQDFSLCLFEEVTKITFTYEEKMSCIELSWAWPHYIYIYVWAVIETVLGSQVQCSLHVASRSRCHLCLDPAVSLFHVCVMAHSQPRTQACRKTPSTIHYCLLQVASNDNVNSSSCNYVVFCLDKIEDICKL